MKITLLSLLLSAQIFLPATDTTTVSGRLVEYYPQSMTALVVDQNGETWFFRDVYCEEGCTFTITYDNNYDLIDFTII